MLSDLLKMHHNKESYRLSVRELLSGGCLGFWFWFGYEWRRWGLGVFWVLIWVEEEVGVAVGG